MEFALIAPMFILMMFGTIAYSNLMQIYSSVQQLVAESARSTIAGLSDTERDQLARSFITSNIGFYPFLDPTRLTTSTAGTAGATPSFKVTVNYDLSGQLLYGFANLLPLPAKTLTRSAVVQRGGF